MPITKSAQRAVRKQEIRRKRNASRKRRIKDLSKKIRGLVSENKKEEAKKMLPKFYKVIDKTTKLGSIKKNTASRRKSKMAKLINKNI